MADKFIRLSIDWKELNPAIGRLAGSLGDGINDMTEEQITDKVMELVNEHSSVSVEDRRPRRDDGGSRY